MVDGTTTGTTGMLLSTSDVLARLRIGRTTLWEMEKRGEFPKAIVLNVRCKRWLAADVERFVDRQQAG